MKYRFENFGGIIASQAPPFLAFVDRQYMRELGLGESPRWKAADQSIGILSAPVEVHFALTNACGAGCPHCYMDAGSRDPGELGADALRRALDLLAQLGVFHIALGGGEALERPDLFDIAAHARTAGMVPNLTISGRHMTPALAEKMSVFGQVNVSLDSAGTSPRGFRGDEQLRQADRALKMLTAAGVPTGINCVVGRQNFDSIPDLFSYASSTGVNEIEFLRLKPSGRGASFFEHAKTTHEQNIELTPLLASLSAKYDIPAKIDCSFIPMLCYHKPPREVLEALSTYGCEAGNVLLGIRSNGAVSGCSFLEGCGLSVFDLPGALDDQRPFATLHTWYLQAPEPCAVCPYLDVCKGGCRAVAKFSTGTLFQPDPECPFVVEHAGGRMAAQEGV